MKKQIASRTSRARRLGKNGQITKRRRRKPAVAAAVTQGGSRTPGGPDCVTGGESAAPISVNASSIVIGDGPPVRRSCAPIKLEKADPNRPREKLADIAAHEADLDRAAATLVGHSIGAVFDMVDEGKAVRGAIVSMLGNMAEAHRRAAARIDNAALKAKLELETKRATKTGC